MEGKKGYLIKPSWAQKSILEFGDMTDVAVDIPHTLNAWLISFMNNHYPGIFEGKAQVLLGRMNA